MLHHPLAVIVFALVISLLLYKRTCSAIALSHQHYRVLPSFYGWTLLLWFWLGSAVLIALGAYAFPSTAFAYIAYASLTLAFLLCHFGVFSLFTPLFHARHHVELWVRIILFTAASLSIFVTIAIVLSMVFEAHLFFKKVPFYDFFFGTHWNPQSTGSFGAVPVFLGTLLITFIAMLVAGPLGVFSAIYLTEYSSRRLRSALKPVLEILAGIPTVVYGYFAVIAIAPAFRSFGDMIGLSIASESALIAGMVMGIMIIPFVLSLTDDVLHAVPSSLRDGALALGATRSETMKQVILPAAFPGIISALLLAISRAVGETMIVVMAAGLTAHLTINPLETVTTVTVQIVTLLVGDQEFDSAVTLAAFALGLTLFVVTLLLNITSMMISKKYRYYL